ncbi:MAG: M17 family peptidase N-terminal domain-containing protein, partial [Candidatus Cloacimonetes bacterium]|nr:M17 family peptidase N-terminal domain-containing protein [Candidatus Cloacimonadota bacterium]
MKIDVTRKLPEHVETLVFIHEEDASLEGLEFVDEELKAELESYIKAENFSFSYGKMSSFTRMLSKKRQVIILCGVGKNADLNSSRLRSIFANCWRKANSLKSHQVYVLMSFEPVINDVILGHVLAESALLSAYKFNKYISSDEVHEIESIHLLLSTKNTRHINRGILEGRIYAEATNLARDMVNEPANIMNPESLADHAKKAALQYGFSIEIHSMDKLKRLKMDALLAVGKGSKVDPRLIIMRYSGNPDKKNQLTALV